jgi:VIT1/CCC1 family predicted Fe2+/Mn2+ transporter
VPDETQAAALLATRFDEVLELALDKPERDALYLRLAHNVRLKPPMRPSLRREDWSGALTSGLLVIFTTLPAALPFAFIDNAYVAMRTSNAVLLAMLFFTGFGWARYTTLRPLLVGTVFLLGGLGLVLIAIPLGG